MRRKTLLLLFIVPLLLACGLLSSLTGGASEETAEPQSEVTEEQIVEEETEEPTAAPPTNTPAPTATPTEVPPTYITAENAGGVEEVATFTSEDGNLLSGVAYHPTEPLVASLGFGGVVRVRNVEERDVVQEIYDTASYSTGLSYSADGSLLGAGSFSNFSAYVWDAETGQLLTQIQPGFRVRKVIFSPDGTAVGVVGNPSSHLMIYDPRSGAKLADYSLSGVYLTAATYSPDGRWVATGNASGVIGVYNAENGSLVAEIEGNRPNIIWDLEFSPDGSQLASAQQDGRLVLWNTDTWSVHRTIDAHQEGGGTIDSAYSKDGSAIISAGNEGNISIWDTESGGKLMNYDSGRTVWALSLNGDGDRFAAAIDDGRLLIFGLSD